MKNYNLFVDCDDTIFSTKDLVVQYMNNRYGIKTNPEDYQCNDSFHEVINKANPKIQISYTDLYLDFGKNFFLSIDRDKDIVLFDGVSEAIPALSDIYNLYVVTSRQNIEKKFIQEILENKGLLKYFSQIHCAWDYINNSYHGIEKADFMNSVKGKNIGFIDDSIKEVKKASQNVYSVLFDPKGLYDKENRAFEVVSSWKQIQKIFT